MTDNSRIISINPTSANQQSNASSLNEPAKIFVDTGNIANWNILKSRKTQLPANEVSADQSK